MSESFRRKKEPRHIRLYHSITGCDAWLNLSGNAVKVLICLARFDDGKSNGQLYFSERTGATETGLSRNTVRRALAELIEKGFIAQTKPGAFNRNNLQAATYRLTWVAYPGGKPAAPTRDFEKWKHGNSQAQILTRSGANFAPPLETEADSGAEFEPPLMETPLVSVTPTMSNIEPQIGYQGDGLATPEIERRKQANLCGSPDLAFLRDSLLAHLKSSDAGEQRRLADSIGIPPGTLSKFIHGKSLPEQYRAPLADAIEHTTNFMGTAP